MRAKRGLQNVFFGHCELKSGPTLDSTSFSSDSGTRDIIDVAARKHALKIIFMNREIIHTLQ